MAILDKLKSSETETEQDETDQNAQQQTRELVLEALSDEAMLERIIDQASDELLKNITSIADVTIKARVSERQKDALVKMRKLAKEHGLSFSAKKKPARRKRRSRKADLNDQQEQKESA